MNFFQHQEKARSRTLLLLLLFTIGVGGIIFALDGMIVLIMAYGNAKGNQPVDLVLTIKEFAPFLVIIAAGVALVIGLASLWKLGELNHGGGAGVATMLGGSLLQPGTHDLKEKRLLNIVEEMAIASGVPVPHVYLMEEEGINAFAAGWSTDSAVIGVTRGCIEELNRDQLQGVVAHEFSHILNGDMRMNIRLMGILFGILFLSVIGGVLIRSITYMRSGKKGDARLILVVLLLGLSLYLLGWIGWLFGRIIQAAVSRQREFLADASAVQFTRNPDGIGGALKKIAGWPSHSKLMNAHASSASHMLFGGVSGFFSLFDTHPSLEERVRRIEGLNFQPPEEVAASESPNEIALNTGLVSNLAGRVTSTAKIAMPVATLDGEARHPAGAAAILYSLLLPKDPQAREKELALLLGQTEPAIAKSLTILAKEIETLPRTNRLPLLALAMPSLKQLGKEQAAELLRRSMDLVRRDGQVDLFELCVWRMGRSALAGKVQSRLGAKDLPKAIGALLAAFADASGEDPATVYTFGLSGLPWSKIPQDIASARADIPRLDQYLDLLSGLKPHPKESLLHACVNIICHDGKVKVKEGELLRATAFALGLPLPPLHV